MGMRMHMYIRESLELGPKSLAVRIITAENPFAILLRAGQFYTLSALLPQVGSQSFRYMIEDNDCSFQLYLTCYVQTDSPMTAPSLSPPSPFPVDGLKHLTCRNTLHYPRPRDCSGG